MSGKASGGGVKSARDVMNYKPPQGPMGIEHRGVGLGGDNHDCGEEGTNEHLSGSSGIGGTNHGNCGSQGRR